MEKRKTIILPFSTSEVNKYNAEIERDRNIIGQRIEAARQERGLNLKELSSLLASYGIPVGNTGISKWTKGLTTRSEERRVRKECRSRWSPYH